MAENRSNECIDCTPLVFADTAKEHLLTLKSTRKSIERQYRKQNNGNSLFAFVKILSSPGADRHYPLHPVMMADTREAAMVDYYDYSWAIPGRWQAREYEGYYYCDVGALLGEIEYADRELFGTYQTLEDALADMARVFSDPESACCQKPEPCEDVEMLPHSPCKKHDIYIPPCDLGCPPVRIEITVLPDKLSYQSGEDIDLTGIVVRAFKANGNLWGGFPHGIIPIEQLDYEPKIYSVDFHGATREPSDTTVTVSWNYNGETFTDTYEIGG